jgi:hypothetical protein
MPLAYHPWIGCQWFRSRSDTEVEGGRFPGLDRSLRGIALPDPDRPDEPHSFLLLRQSYAGKIGKGQGLDPHVKGIAFLARIDHDRGFLHILPNLLF